MPHTLQYRPKLIDTLITNERIGSYHAVFNTKNDVELIGVYLWNTHVCGAIYPLISLAEITLRNSIDHALTAKIGQYWWNKLRYKSFIRGKQEPDSVTNLKNKFKSAKSLFIQEQRRAGVTGFINPPHSGIIAKTDFSTWEFILDDEFMGNSLIWPSRLGAVFSGDWRGRKPTLLLTDARNLVSTIRDFRNRISHHEPAWKRHGVRNETDAILHLREKIAKIEELIRLINPESHVLLQKNWLLENAYRACSSEEISRFKHSAQTHSINSFDDLKELVTMQNNSTLKAQIDNEGIMQDFLIVT